MKKSKVFCDGDCFRCKYPDCVAPIEHIYKLAAEEKKRLADMPCRNVSSKLSPESDLNDVLRNTIGTGYKPP